MRKFGHGGKLTVAKDQGEYLWFSDRREEAKQLDPDILWLDFEESECRRAVFVSSARTRATKVKRSFSDGMVCWTLPKLIVPTLSQSLLK